MPREPDVPGLRRALRNPAGRIERDVDDELAFHIESRVGELTARGHAEESARRYAEIEFGDLRASRRELAAVDRHRRRRELRTLWLEATAHDFRRAVRSLRRSPLFTIAAILTLTIGIGASVAIFALVNGVLLRPLPFGNPGRLVAASHDLPPLALLHEPQTASTYFAYQRLAHTIEGIGVYLEGEVNVADPGGGGGGGATAERMIDAKVSASLIPVLQVLPLIGRTFNDADDQPGAAPVMLISERMWRGRFAGDRKIIGRRLELDGVSREIVGVMPESFRFPAAATPLWIPLELDPVNPPPTAYSYFGIARLKPSVTIADAERDFSSVLARLPELFPNFVAGISTQAMIEQMHPKPVLVPLNAEITGAIAGTLWMVAAAALLVLLVACANVANLTLVRADARQREIAVLQALGASRARLVLRFFAESALVTVVATVVGFTSATVAVRSLVAAGPAGIPRLAEVKVDATAVLFAIVVAAFVAAACSLLPAIRVLRSRSLALREGGRSGTAGRMQHRVRGGLVVAQIAFALVVLSGAGLLLRTFERLNSVRPGFDPEHVSTFWMSLPSARYKSDTSVVRFYARLVDRVAALPGASTVGLTSRLPLEAHGVNENPLYPEDDASYATKLPPLQLFTAVNADYFKTMRIPLLAGRAFDRTDAQRSDEAMISLSSAKAFWKDSTGASALGKRFRPLPTGRLYTVIGVVGDTRDTALAAPPSQVVYFPEALESNGIAKRTQRAMALVVRTAGGTSIDAAVRQAVHDLDPTVPTFDVRPMSAVVGAATAQLTFVIIILGAAAAVTLVLGAVGLYGVLAYVVTLRTRELGIRMALGATPNAVAAAMTRYGVGLAGVGIGIGLALFALVARFLRAMLFGVTVGDPLALGGAALLLVALALLASWLPARRAARIDPASALRAE
jgi:putative ABC transport system permease protein